MKKIASFVSLVISLTFGLLVYNILHTSASNPSDSITEIASDITQNEKEKFVMFDIVISRENEKYGSVILNSVQRAILKFDEDKCLIFVSGNSFTTPDPSGKGSRRIVGLNFKCENLGENGHRYHHGNRIYNLLNLNKAIRAELEDK